MELPSGFIEMMHGLLGDEADDFLRAMGNGPVVAIRLNSRKPTDAFVDCRHVKWCPTGRYLESRPSFTLDPLLHAGAYYVQDASSMILYECVRRIASDSPVSLLDLCAAPGGKTTAMIDALPDGSRVVANEYVGKRAAVLKENLAKWGYPHVAVTNRDSSWFAGNADCFDIVAVDAPCSGEGMMRKDPDAIAQWSPELIQRCADLQREILANAVKAVAPSGFLIYSTCTFNRKENEENAEFIKKELGMIPFDPGFPEEWGIPRGIATSLPVFRFMPHRTEGEGLFLAMFRKPGNSSVTSLSRKDMASQSFPKTGETPHSLKKHKSDSPPRYGRRHKSADQPYAANSMPARDIPEIEEILSTAFNRSSYPLVELSKDQALAYLRRESLVLSPGVPKGIVIATYRGLPLGPMKNIGSRANNLYPKNWRILMR